MHTSGQVEAGIARQVAFEMAAVAAGPVAEKLECAEMGQSYRFRGFMARKTRNSRSLVLHLTDFDTIS